VGYEVEKLAASINYRQRPAVYDETRGGLDTGVGKELWPNTRGFLNLRLEAVDINNIAVDAPPDVRQVAGSSGTTRRTRATALLAVAAMVTVAALGWGAAMAGRAEKFADQAALAEARRTAALQQFDRVLKGLVPSTALPTDETHLGQLTPAPGREGGGAVLQLVSPTLLDFTIVLVNGLPRGDVAAMPYRVTLENAAGEVLKVGRITQLDANGGADVYRQYEEQSLSGFTKVLVRDASGEIVLSGTVDQSG